MIFLNKHTVVLFTCLARFDGQNGRGENKRGRMTVRIFSQEIFDGRCGKKFPSFLFYFFDTFASPFREMLGAFPEEKFCSRSYCICIYSESSRSSLN